MLPECVNALMHIVKINLRSFLRREMTNRSLKIECTVKLIHMYLAADCEGFFLKCARDISNEFKLIKPLQEKSLNFANGHPDIYEALLRVSQGVNWNQKQACNIADEFKALLTQVLGI